MHQQRISVEAGGPFLHDNEETYTIAFLLSFIIFFKFYPSKVTSAFASTIFFLFCFQFLNIYCGFLYSKNASFAVSHVAAGQNTGFHSYIYLPICPSPATLCLMNTHIVKKWMAKISWVFYKFDIKNGWIKSRNIPERR